MKNNNRTATINFIFITLLIDITGFGIIIPVLPNLIKELIHGDISEASRIGGWLSFMYALIQFFFAPVLGNLSDRYGRRPIILMALIGFTLNYLIQAVAPSIFWLFVGRILAGITGASITTSTAYIADISNNENRTKNFGIIGAAFGLGFILGPVLGGLLGHFGSRVPFYAAAVLCLLNFLYGYYILPESLAKDKRRKFSWKRANPVGSLLHLKQYPAIYGLIATYFFIYVASHAVQSNWSFYTIYKFHWDEKMVGISLGVVGVLVSLVQGLLIRWVNPKLGNAKSIVLGLMFYCVGLLCFGLASQSWMMFAFCVPYCLGGIAGPALQSIISGTVQANAQGELQGALTGLMSVTTIIGPLLMTNLFYFFTHSNAPINLPGAPFFAGALLMLASSFIAAFSFKSRRIK